MRGCEDASEEVEVDWDWNRKLQCSDMSEVKLCRRRHCDLDRLEVQLRLLLKLNAIRD